MNKLTTREKIFLALLPLAVLAATQLNQIPFNTDSSASKTLFVDTFGNDSTAIRGRPDLPWAKVEVAATNAQPGDTIKIGPGTFNCSNYFACPINGAVIGAGTKATFVIDFFTNANPTPQIIASDNGFVANMTISNYWGDSLAACIGTHQSLGVRGYTNFRCENLALYGGSDTWYNRHTNNLSGEMQNCFLSGPWDVVTAFNTATQRYDFRNCTFVNRAIRSHAGIVKDVLVAQGSADVTFRLWGCSMVMSNGFDPDDYYLNIGDQPTTQRAEFHACTFTNETPRAAPPAEWNISSALVTFDPSCSGVDPLAFNDDLSTAPGVRWSRLVTTNITFGGNGEGRGPTITSGAGAPSANEPNGSIYFRTDGGTTTSIYVRSGGNTWTAK